MDSLFLTRSEYSPPLNSTHQFFSKVFFFLFSLQYIQISTPADAKPGSVPCSKNNVERQALQQHCQLFRSQGACIINPQGQIFIIYYKGITFFMLWSKRHLCNLERCTVQHNELFIPFQGASSNCGIISGKYAKNLHFFHESSKFTTVSISKHNNLYIYIWNKVKFSETTLYLILGCGHSRFLYFA